jgi:hypothetical protein
MGVLSKPLFFGSCYTEGVSQTYRRVKTRVNAHFWIEKAGQVIEPTHVLPPATAGARRIYLPFTDAEQKSLNAEWMSAHKSLWGVDEDEVMNIIDDWKFPFDKGSLGKCWFNSLKYQMEHGGKLVCGLMGHYDKELGCVDVDYGY